MLKLKKMKIIGLGDTHGRDNWVKIVSKELDSDKIVFIGDYFDSRDNYTTSQQIDNFLAILDFKRKNIDKVILLIGNHDFHYLSGIKEQYSGFQFGGSVDINKVLEDAIKEGLMQMCYVNDNFVFSHAGITNTWMNRYPINLETLEFDVNELFNTTRKNFCFSMGNNFSQTGNDICQTPIWVRPQSLIADAIEGLTYIVGHTTVDELTINKNTPNVIFIDCLGTSGQYLVIENGSPIPESIK